jgi:hypothetical protein
VLSIVLDWGGIRMLGGSAKSKGLLSGCRSPLRLYATSVRKLTGDEVFGWYIVKCEVNKVANVEGLPVRHSNV